MRPDPAQDVLKIAVVERHGQNGNIAVAFAKGFGLQRGAIGSTVAHDHHNIVVRGARDADLAACVRALVKMLGGFVPVAGVELLASLELGAGIHVLARDHQVSPLIEQGLGRGAVAARFALRTCVERNRIHRDA